MIFSLSPPLPPGINPCTTPEMWRRLPLACARTFGVWLRNIRPIRLKLKGLTILYVFNVILSYRAFTARNGGATSLKSEIVENLLRAHATITIQSYYWRNLRQIRLKLKSLIILYILNVPSSYKVPIARFGSTAGLRSKISLKIVMLWGMTNLA